jgi:hypothetical protein
MANKVMMIVRYGLTDALRHRVGFRVGCFKTNESMEKVRMRECVRPCGCSWEDEVGEEAAGI